MNGRNPERSGWCILRTAGPRTLTLARSLAAAGVRVWTPMLTDLRRMPRTTAKREVEMPILPTFVFAQADDLPELERIRAAPFSPHPAFSIFRHAGRTPLVTECQIEGLRAEEERTAALHQAYKDRKRRDAEKTEREQILADLRANAPTYADGAKVGVAQQAFTGMVGTVEKGKGRNPVVNFGGGWRVEIEAWLLEPAVL